MAIEIIVMAEEAATALEIPLMRTCLALGRGNKTVGLTARGTDTSLETKYKKILNKTKTEELEKANV